MPMIHLEEIWKSEPIMGLQELCRHNTMEVSEIFPIVMDVLSDMEEYKQISREDIGDIASLVTGKMYLFMHPSKIHSNIDAFPMPLYHVLLLYYSEINPFRKVHRLIDVFEWSIKWHTVLVMCDLLQQTDISDEMKVLFSSGLRVPSLGIWLHFFRSSLDNIRTPSYPWKQWESLLALENKYHIVAFRNEYSHGATRSDLHCAQDCLRWFPILEELLLSPLFTDFQMVYADDNCTHRWVGGGRIPSNISVPEGRVFLVHRDNPELVVLNLWPLCLASVDERYPQKGRQFFYFNALKNKAIEQLNYAWSLRHRDKDLWDMFHETIPINEWKRISTPELDIFRERVDALTEIFKGRQDDKAIIRQFCLQGEGTQMVWGLPGIGKSALLAQVYKEIRGGVDIDGAKFTENYPIIIPYFIRRGTQTTAPERFLRYLCQQLDVLFDICGLAMGNGTIELSENLQLRLQVIASRKNSTAVVLFIDGLDECVDEVQGILPFIPTPKPWLRILCASRHTPQIDSWFRQRDRRVEYTVQPLSTTDVRAILYDVIGKYHACLDGDYVNVVEYKSQGNPLYLKLLCDQIDAGVRQVGVVDDLPSHMGDLYKEVLQRVTDQGRNDTVYKILLLFTETKATLSTEMVADFLDISEQLATFSMDRCLELLFEHTTTTNKTKYQLFHESLRTYIREIYAKDTRKMISHVTNFCYGWQKLEGETLQYALEFLAHHLQDQGDTARVWLLMQDEEYRKMQIKVSTQFSTAYASILVGIRQYVDNTTHTPEDDAKLCWLVLRAGQLAQEAIQSVHIAFEWFAKDVSFLDYALERIEVLDNKNYVKACLRLLLMETQRQEKLDPEKRNISIPIQILDTIEERISERLDWHSFIVERFLVWLLSSMYQTWPNLHLDSIYRRTSKSDDLLQKLAVYQLHKGDIDGALVFIRSIQHVGVKVQSLMTVYPFVMNTGKKEQGEDIFQQSVDLAESILNKTQQSEVLAQVSTQLLDMGDMERAVAIAQSISDGTLQSQVFAKIATVWLDTEDAEKSIAISNCISDKPIKYNIIKTIAQFFISRKEIEAVLEMIETISVDHVKFHILQRMVPHLYTKENIQKFTLIASSIVDTYQRCSLLLELIDVVVKMNISEDAQNILHQVQTLVLSIPDIVQRNRILGTIGTTFANMGDTEQALVVIESISDESIQSEYLLKITTSVEKKQDIEKTISIANAIAIEDTRCIVLLNIIDILLQKNMREDAENTVRQVQIFVASISDFTKRHTLLRKISTILANMGDTDQATAIQNSIQAEAVAMLEQLSVSHIETVPSKVNTVQKNIEDLVHQGKISQALVVIESISDDKTKSKLVPQVINWLDTKEEIYKTITIVTSIDDKHTGCILLLQMVNDFWKRNLRVDAGYILHQVQTLVLSIPDIVQRNRILGTIGTTFANMGDTEQALVVIESISDESIQSEYLLKITTSVEKKQDIEKAISIANTIVYPHDRANVLLNISTVLVQRGDITHALLIAESIPNDREKSKSLSNIVNSLDTKEHIDKAISIANTIVDETRQSSILSKIVGVLEKQHDIDAEQAILEKTISIREYTEDTNAICIALRDFSKILADKGEIDWALLVAQSISDTSLQSNSQIYIAKVLAKIPDIDKILSILQSIPDLHTRNKALLDISIIVARTGNIEQTLALTEFMLDKSKRSYILSELAQILSNTGDIDRALVVAESISEDWIKAATLSTIVALIEKKEHVDTVITLAHSLVDAYNTCNVLLDSALVLVHISHMEEQAKSLVEQVRSLSSTIVDTYQRSLVVDAIAKIFNLVTTTESIETTPSIPEKDDTVMELLTKGEVGQALFVVASITDDREKSDYVSKIVHSLYTQEHIDHAISIANTIMDECNRCTVWLDMATFLVQIGNIEQARNVVEYVQTISRSIANNCDQSFNWLGVCETLVRIGFVEQTMEILSSIVEEQRSYLVLKILEFVEKKQDIEYILRYSQVKTYDKNIILAKASRILANKGAIDTALSHVASLADINLKHEVLFDISTNLVDKGEFERLVLILQQIMDDNVIFNILEYTVQHSIALGRLETIHRHLSETKYSTLLYEQFLPFYQKVVTDTQYIRYSFLYAPFSYKLSSISVVYFLRHYLQQGNKSYIAAILDQCPQLQVYLQKPTSKTIEYTYATWEQWIDSIVNEDDADIIRMLANKVYKGSMTEQDFEIRVKKLLGL